MSTKSSTNELYVPCVRGSHALGELVLVEESEKDGVETKEARPVGVAGGTPVAASTPVARSTPVAVSTPVASSTPVAPLAGSSPRCGKKRRRVNSRWGKRSPEDAHRPSLTLRTQPELDDVDGLVFASFDSKVNNCYD